MTGAEAGAAAVPPEVPPAWQTAIPTSTPGWQRSQTPLCDRHRGPVASFGIWADTRGVFALVADECLMTGIDMPSCTPEREAQAGASLQFNDGAGWRALLDVGSPSTKIIAGFPGGPLLLTGGNCDIASVEVEHPVPTCDLPAANFDAVVAFTVSQDEAYAVAQNQLWHYGAGRWSVVVAELPDAMSALWAAPDIVYLAGGSQPYIWKTDGTEGVVPLANAPVGSYTAVWGFKKDDVWFGNTVGQLVHYDGSAFDVLRPSTLQRGGIQGLWGSDGRLFFHSRFDFGRITNGSIETVLKLAASPAGASNPRIHGLWGRSANEVFLALDDSSSFDTATCSARFVLWFDGAAFHRF